MAVLVSQLCSAVLSIVIILSDRGDGPVVSVYLYVLFTATYGDDRRI